MGKSSGPQGSMFNPREFKPSTANKLTPREAKIQREILQALQGVPGVWLFNVHGSARQQSGIPDLVGCYRGRFFGIEVKRPGEVRTPKQTLTMEKIASADGLTGVATCIEEALEIIGAPPCPPTTSTRRRTARPCKPSSTMLSPADTA